MNPIRTGILSSLLIALAGCASRRSPVLGVRPLPATSFSANQAVRYPETLRAYYLGRYVEGGDGLLMHEGHVFYRVEQTSRWNLQPGASGDGPLVTPQPLANAAHSPAPLNDEAVAELHRQQEVTAAVTAEADQLTGSLHQLGQAVAQTGAIAEQNVKLREQLNAAVKRLDLLEAEFKQQRLAPAPTNTAFQP